VGVHPTSEGSAGRPSGRRLVGRAGGCGGRLTVTEGIGLGSAPNGGGSGR
jgi:hypothetical protein